MSSFDGLENLSASSTTIDGTDILPLALRYRAQLNKDSNIGELAAFVCYATCFPDGFLALVDTYVLSLSLSLLLLFTTHAHTHTNTKILPHDI